MVHGSDGPEIQTKRASTRERRMAAWLHGCMAVKHHGAEGQEVGKEISVEGTYYHSNGAGS